MNISLIAALDKGRVIGNKGQIPWYLIEDLKHFQKITKFSAVIMGRKTFESIGTPLPDRLNVVMTRTPRGITGVEEVLSKEEALEVASSFSEEVFVIGGENIYTEFMPLAVRMYLTIVNLKVDEDTVFPKWDEEQWIEVSNTKKVDKSKNIKFSFVEYLRKP